MSELRADIEHVFWQDELLAMICRSSFSPARTEFLTPPAFNQQVGFIVYPRGGVIQPHTHARHERRIVGMSEVVVVRSGRMEAAFYNANRELVTKKMVEAGDVLLLVGGGHGFRMFEDTVLLEVKQGPFIEAGDKEHYES